MTGRRGAIASNRLLRPLNNDEFIGTEVGANGASLPLVRASGGRLERPAINRGRRSRPAINNDGKARPASKRKREQVEQLRVPARDDDPVARHTV